MLEGASKRCWRSVVRLNGFFLLLFLFLAPAARAIAPGDAPSSEKPRVLVLHSYHQGYPWTDRVHQGILAALSSFPSLDLHVEYMDLKRHFTPDCFQELGRLYRHKYFRRGKRFDAIVCSDDLALDFLLEYRERLFPKTPVVFCGVNHFEASRLRGRQGFTGINEEISLKETLELALKLHPGTRRVAVVSDSTETGRRNRELLKAVEPHYPGMEFAHLAELEPPELKAALERLDPRSAVVLHLSYLATPGGQTLGSEESALLVSEASPAPVYTCWSFVLRGSLDAMSPGYGFREPPEDGSSYRPGSVGGVVASGFAQGREAGRMVERILRGESADDIPVLMESPNLPMFDHAQLHRLSIKESALPPGSVVLNKPFSFYEAYKAWIWAACLFMIAETLLVAGLIATHARRKTAQRDLNRGHRFLRTLLNAAPTPIFFLDARGRCRRCNEAFARLLLGTSPEAVTDPVPRKGGDGPDLETFFPSLHGPPPSVYCETVPCADGVVRDFLVHTVPVPDLGPGPVAAGPGFNGHGSGVLTVMTDLTEQRLAQQELRRRNEELALLLDSIDVQVWYLVDEETYGAVNAAHADFLGIPRQRLEGRPLTAFLPPEEVRVCRESNRRVFRSGEQVCTEEWVGDASGEPRLLSIVKSPWKRPDGTVEFVVCAARDMTERVRAEEARLEMERRMQQAKKMESLGMLAGGIAHDFNNILMAVQGHAEMVLEGTDPDDSRRSSLNEILNASRRAADLCRRMLDCSGKNRGGTEELDLGDLIREATQLLRSSVSKKIDLDVSLASRLPRVRGDGSEIARMLMNLVVNASEAIGEGYGAIRVSADALRLSRRDLREAGAPEDFPPGPCVRLEVKDTGCGMGPEVLERVFDPFFTTKFLGRGLGMSSVMGIVRAHRGSVEAESEVGRGTTFRVLLPAVEGGAPLPAVCDPARPESKSSFGRGTVLLVDDEESTREVARMMLETGGLRVLEACDGLEALELYKERMDEIDLVFLDLNMPRMDGKDAFRRLHAVDPSVRVVLTSGYPEEQMASGLEGLDPVGLLQKPFTLNGLGELLRKVLGAEARSASGGRFGGHEGI